jgi:hypothetical protein
MLAGLWAWWQSRRASDAPEQVLEPVAATSPETPYISLARIWLLTTLAALLLKTVPMLYWADPWDERHAELRLFLGALGLYGLYQLPLERLRRNYLNANYMAWVGTGLGVACLLALWLVLSKGSNAAPTNRIPWAAALTLSTCTLLTLAKITLDSRLRYIWLAASLAGLLAVLASDVRGAFGLAGLGALFVQSETFGDFAACPFESRYETYCGHAASSCFDTQPLYPKTAGAFANRIARMADIANFGFPRGQYLSGCAPVHVAAQPECLSSITLDGLWA